MDFRSVLGTSYKRQLTLMEKLYYRRDGWSSDELLLELDCSLPILLNDIEVINQMHPDYNITKVKGLYRLEMDNSINLGNLYADILNLSSEFQILEELLYERCDSISAISRKLFLSTSNTQRCLKKVEKSLLEAGMELCYRPLRIEGNEGEIRWLYYRFFNEQKNEFEGTLPMLTIKQYDVVEKYIQDFTKINEMYRKYTFDKYLVYNFFISLWRIKNKHPFPPEKLRTNCLKLPFGDSHKALREVVHEFIGIELTPDILRDCFWSIFSDAIIFSLPHRNISLEENPRYIQLFDKHYELSEKFNQLLGNHLDEAELLDLATVLSNDFYLYEPESKYLGVLRQNRQVFMEEVSKFYGQGVKKVQALVESFVAKHQMYQEADFVLNYVYLLITTEVKSLEWLASQDPPLRVLLISELAMTEETFLGHQIQNAVYGNFTILHFEHLIAKTSQLIEELKKYDCLITTGSSEGLPEDYPVIVIDPFLTEQSTRWIQAMISQLSEQKSQALVVENQ